MHHLLLIFILVAPHAFAAKFVGELSVPLENAFIPAGYDNDDSVQLVVTGRFTKPCLQLGVIETIVERNSDRILVELGAYEYEGDCLAAGTLFHRVVHLGRIRRAGTYRIIDRTSKKELGALTIDEAGQGGVGTDSLRYAPLTDAYLETARGKTVLVLRGVHSGGGGELKVEFRPQKGVLVALPVLEPAGRRGREGAEPFEVRVPVTGKVPAVPFLLHVRAMGGQAIHKMVYAR